MFEAIRILIMFAIAFLVALFITPFVTRFLYRYHLEKKNIRSETSAPVFYKFHKDQLEQEARRRIIEEEIAKLWGPISVRCVLGEKTVRQSPQAVMVPAAESVEMAVKEAEEIFGV